MSLLYKISIFVSRGHIRLIDHFIRRISFRNKKQRSVVDLPLLVKLVSGLIRQTVS